MARAQRLSIVLWTLMSLRTAAALPSSSVGHHLEPIFSDPDCEGTACSGVRPPVPPPPSPPPPQLTQVDSPNSGGRKHRDAGAVRPFLGLTNSGDQSRSCCENGGTCILGSFCACAPFFTGRTCEYDTRVRMCDVTRHGEWVRRGCSYCRCGYGLLHCFPDVFHDNCDDPDQSWYRSSVSRIASAAHFLSPTLLPLLLPLLSLF
ncbi:teratocarcinoma-derived growth factor 1 [Cololabis saira]|uniref:teratocarcinoma-derived growth factor 1 n=1 Tax=Cololabis saira TaxID=129043 RepID=UPI002AD542AF|nr:teratocarcinoma-derived growth factor 1 [Cololabis saira]